MVLTLHFNGSQIGTVFKRAEPGHVPLTPPVFHTGLFQATAGVVSDARNLLYRMLFYVTVKAASNVQAALAIGLIQALAGETGDIEVKDGSSVELLCEGWVIESVSQPALLDAFGGRFAEEIVITAVGTTPPE